MPRSQEYNLPDLPHACSFSQHRSLYVRPGNPKQKWGNPACPSSLLGFLHSNALWAFCSKKKKKTKPSSLAPSHMLCLATEPKPCAGSSSPGSLQRQAQQRAWLPAAGARAAAPGCFGREPWLTCWAACPSRASCFVRQQQAGVVGQCWCTVQLQLFV